MTGDAEKSIFLSAIEIPSGDERAAFLERACAGNPGLRAEVDALLLAHEKPLRLLDAPGAASPTIADPIVEGPETVIGPYKLLEQIGEGGFGVVFMAEQTEPVRRKVALKVLKPGMDTRQVVARFEAERQALAIMDHPNIAKVFDGGATLSGRPYFVMELVKGVPLTEFCDQNHLSPRQRLELFVSVCQAVQHAHQKGIIHRDLKPSNILVTMHDTRPVPKVIDFGVAKALGQELTDKTLFTGFAQMVGTPLYMSPEQAGQSGLDIDTRSDIYSLGVLLYELLTGTTPFDKERFKQAAYDEIRRIIREEEPPKPSTRLSDSKDSLPSISAQRQTEPAKLTRLLRGELDWIVMKALEKDRNRRYDTANSLALDVQRYLADEPVLACPPSFGYRVRKFARRNRGPVLAAAVVMLALVVGIIGMTWGLLRAIDAEAKAISEAKLKETALTAAQRSEQQAKKSLRLSLYEQARAHRFSRHMGQRLGSLDALAKAAAIRPDERLPDERLPDERLSDERLCDERLRDEAIAAMALPDVRFGPAWQVLTPGYKGAALDGQYQQLAFDGQYRLYACLSDPKLVSIRTLPGHREIGNFASPPMNLKALLLSPDGRYLAKLTDHFALNVWRLSDRHAVVREESQRTFGFAFSPDSRQLAVCQQDWILRFDLATGQELNRWQLPVRSAHCLAFHPDNRRLAIGYESSTFASVFDATNGELIANLPVGKNLQQVVAWHPDGERLAFGGSDPHIQIWHVPAMRKVATLEGHVRQIVDLDFHPDGSLLASASWDGSTRLWDPATGRQLLQFSHAASIGFSSDGRWLGFATHGEQAQLLEVTPTREYRTLVSSLGAGQGGYNLDADISPDGRLLAQGMDDAVRLWDLASGRELAVLPYGRPLFQSNEELLIAGAGGLQRWPIQSGATANELYLGPPRTPALPAVPTRAARTPDGRTLAIAGEKVGGSRLVDLASDSVRAPHFGHQMASHVALSPDGRWLASSGWHSDRVRLWSVETGKMVHEWKLFRAMVFFTPDSRTLIVSQGGEFSFHDVETRQPVRHIRRDVAQYPGHVAFSPDGRLMALEMAPGIIHLKDVATARTVAKLEDPHGDRSGWMSFTPNGTQLVAASPYGKAIHVWDLRAIRQRLKAMGLDWDWEDYPPAVESDGPLVASAAPTIHVISADCHFKRGVELANKGLLEEAVAEYRKAIALDPKHARTYHSLGLALFDQNKVDDAIVCYEKAIDIDPDYAWAHNSLGGVFHYQRKLDKAIACYKKAIHIDPRHAWAYNNLGAALRDQKKTAEAIICYQKAIEIDPRHAWAHNNLGVALRDQKKLDEAIASHRRAIHIDPKCADHINLGTALNERAWALATDPEPTKRDPGRAVELAKEAVQLGPKEWNWWNTLGVAHYRARDWKAALGALETSMQLRKGGNSFDWFFVAMAHWQLDAQDKAREWYDRAVAWMDKNQAQNEELRRFRAEAAELMRVKQQH